MGVGILADELLMDPPTAVHPVGLFGPVTRVLRRNAPQSSQARLCFSIAVAGGLLAGAAAVAEQFDRGV